MTATISFTHKFFTCTVLAIVSASFILLLGTDNGLLVSPVFVFAVAILALLIPFVLLPVWEYRQKRRGLTGSTIYYNVQNIIAVLTGICISIFGWKKVFGLQFRFPMSLADLPMSAQSGEALTWYYYSYSHTFGLLIAAFQVGASALLYFPKTRFAGLLILLPVMFNILMGNIFYHMNPGALTQSAVLTLTIIYQFFQYRKQLVIFLFSSFPQVSKSSNVIAFIGIVFPLLMIAAARQAVPVESGLFGKYELSAVRLSGKPAADETTLQRDSVPTLLYFDLNNVCVLQMNNIHSRLLGKYVYDKQNGEVKATLVNEGKLYPLQLKTTVEADSRHYHFSGSFNNMPVSFEGTRLR